MKFKKKTVVVEAVQFKGHNTQEINDFIEARVYDEMCSIGIGKDCKPENISIKTLEGDMILNINDWIIKESYDYYPCKPDIFEETYEKLE